MQAQAISSSRVVLYSSENWNWCFIYNLICPLSMCISLFKIPFNSQIEEGRLGVNSYRNYSQWRTAKHNLCSLIIKNWFTGQVTEHSYKKINTVIYLCTYFIVFFRGFFSHWWWHLMNNRTERMTNRKCILIICTLIGTDVNLHIGFSKSFIKSWSILA